MNRRQSAQLVVWLAVMLPLLFLPIIGLAMDAGTVFDARRGLQNVADGAARVGAMELDQASIRSGGPVRIDTGKAYGASHDYVAQMAPDSISTIAPRTDSVTVTLESTVKPKFLSLLKVKPVPVQATARARPCTAEGTPSCQ